MNCGRFADQMKGWWPMRGFSLIEMMIALVVLTFGLLSTGQMLFIAASSGSLAHPRARQLSQLRTRSNRWRLNICVIR
jgi:prepilin-type N-terminal cleavage/methylation domain-containing protein